MFTFRQSTTLQQQACAARLNNSSTLLVVTKFLSTVPRAALLNITASESESAASVAFFPLFTGVVLTYF
jgi:L-cystine uptake protein TcyP (sodium:dicarboxylate symporter family)